MWSEFAVPVLPFFCLAMKCSSPIKLYSGSASAGYDHGKSRSVSNVMFHLMCFMLGRKLIVFREKNNPFHFGQRFSDVLKFCI